MASDEDEDTPQDKLRKVQRSLEEARLCYEVNCEFLALDAKLLKARHENLIKAGFTENQAMAVICSRGTS